ncbi:MAG: hypothetical protein OXG15_01140 [Gammaproteobacteria bacterium]|nr:hypothetical protein [Gammaproteobacteria bacterium]
MSAGEVYLYTPNIDCWFSINRNQDSFCFSLDAEDKVSSQIGKAICDDLGWSREVEEVYENNFYKFIFYRQSAGDDNAIEKFQSQLFRLFDQIVKPRKRLYDLCQQVSIELEGLENNRDY